MKQTYKMPTTVEFAQTNFNLKLKLYELVNKMQESSSLHAEELGMGYEVLESNNIGWVISRYRIKMDKYPSFEDNITIETWPSGLDKILAMRSFEICNESQEKIGSIYCAYVLIDATTGRIQRTSKLPIDLPVLENEAKEKDLEKLHIENYKEGLVNTYEREVHYTDIDVNMHMNNACYVQWIEDAFPLEKYKDMKINEIQVNFISGVTLGEKVIVKVYKDKQSEDNYYVQGKAKEDLREVFQAKVEWN